jgi:HK97 family phage major capsid protein
MNRTDFDLVSYVVTKVAEAISVFLGKECLIGTAGKMTGVMSSTNGITTASGTAFTADELVDLQDVVPDAFQNGCVWIMSKKTRGIVRKMKDGQGNYLMLKDATTGFKNVLFGQPVFVDRNIPDIALGAKAVFYGDPSGLTLKISKAVEIQMLLEKYAEFHMVGVIGYVEADSKITEPQKLAVLTMKAV